jgi:hypothetical protein
MLQQQHLSQFTAITKHTPQQQANCQIIQARIHNTAVPAQQ